MPQASILMVDSDPSIARLSEAAFETAGWKTRSAVTGEQALSMVNEESPDLMVLAIGLPGMDGFEVCRQIRDNFTFPIIMLSNRDEVEAKIKCLELGADDYVAKPFSVLELVARIQATLRRCEITESASTEKASVFGDLEIDLNARRVQVKGCEVRLTGTEYRLLHELVLNAGKVMESKQLLHSVWGEEYGDDLAYLHEYIGRLRHKIEPDLKNPEYIFTVHGVGYRFRDMSTG